MDSDSWSRLSKFNSSSRRYQSRSEAFHLVDEFESDEEARPEFLCPFCAEDFDIVGLCCHIDEEHTIEAKNGRRFRKGGGAISMLKKELREGNLLQSLVGGGSSFLAQPSNNVEPEPWLSSFISNTTPMVLDQPLTTQPPPAVAANSKSFVDTTNEDLSQRSNQKQKLSDKDEEEKGRRSEFVQGLLFSTFLDDAL
ncbi:hypothetical protein L6452_18748 [Arctium lappa]|uniref:Uncharacterized protein n=1 Tax=Arctium lappa TaxID=4217 RepID=A0ACB9C718_ARCLA|nr:hypothetical protein L6452_18748 [Arctium lappa]